MSKKLGRFVLVASLWLGLSGMASALTLTVYPDPHTEVTSVDGYANVASTLSWADLRIAAGTNAVDNGVQLLLRMDAFGSTDVWAILGRVIMVFDTSTLGSANISAATLSLYGVSKQDPATAAAPTYNLYQGASQSNTIVGNADYQGNLNQSTELTTTFTYASFTTSAYNDYTLNAAGLSHINKNGVTKISWKIANYDVGAQTPTWSAGTDARAVASSADETGTSQDPKLVITYTLVTGRGGPLILRNYEGAP
jgi:hypothetical protein